MMSPFQPQPPVDWQAGTYPAVAARTVLFLESLLDA